MTNGESLPPAGGPPGRREPEGEEPKGSERGSRWRRRRPRPGTPPGGEGAAPRGAKEPRDVSQGRERRGGREAGEPRGKRPNDRWLKLPVHQRSAAPAGPRGPRGERNGGRGAGRSESVRPERMGPAPVQPPALKVLIAGGGTGGHIYPALAVADEIRRRNSESRILFVGTQSGLEGRLVPEAGFEIEFLDLSGYVGRGLFARIRALFQFGSGVLRARRLIRRFDPELVLGTGGYVSGPAVLAGRLAGKATMIQEQNSVPGKMNRILSRWVDEVHVAFTETRSHFKHKSKIRLSGNPVLSRKPRGSVLALFQRYRLSPDRRTVLIFGGSRGARSLNRAVAAMLPHFRARDDIQFVVQTGPEDHAMVLEAARAAGVTALVKPYLSPMEDFYTMATMVVCRAGAMTLAEVMQFALPALLIPYPHAIYQHQLKNAEILTGKGAAELLLDEELSPAALAARIEALLADEGRRRELARNAWRLARPDAHERVVNAIEQLTHPVARRQPLDMDQEEAAAAEAP